MDDLISRQAAIDAILAEVEDEDRPIVETRWWNIGMTRASVIVHDMPSAEEMAFNEWCTDCKEYNHEKGCCPRFNRAIHEAVEEVKEAHEEAIDAVEVVQCKDCTYAKEMTQYGCGECVRHCEKLKIVTSPEWYCAEGRKKDETALQD